MIIGMRFEDDFFLTIDFSTGRLVTTQNKNDAVEFISYYDRCLNAWQQQPY